ncbi:DMP19 family protein [Myxococcus fulvus]|uniref:DMP19 family protein n=1 Tax=Myxococcus fulvus TaxID=33 RepID=UPI003B9DC130
MLPDDNRIIDVRFDEQNLLLRLTDGRVLSLRYGGYIRIHKATPEQRREWVLTEDGRGVNWPALWPPAPEGMVSVWALEQDALYEHALARLQQVHRDLSALPPDERELVALWRMEADINNGGFMQFFCNWGEETCHLAIEALGRIGAQGTRQCLNDMLNIVAHYGETEEMVSLSDLPGMLTPDERDRLYALDQAFWKYPEPLDKAVVRHYAPRVAPPAG